MSKGEYVGVGNIAHKVKKEYVGVDGIARKVKKIYIGDSNNKARLAWSGFTPMFVGIGSVGNDSNAFYRVKYSENATTWNSIDSPFSYATRASTSNGIVYGNNKYLFANVDRLAYSEDGISWTYYDVPKNDTAYSTYLSNISYCNSMFFLFRFLSNTWVYEIFTSSDGINWTFRSSIDISSMDYVKVVYCTLGGKNVYVFINNQRMYYSENLLSWTRYDNEDIQFINIFVSTHNNNLYAIYFERGVNICNMYKFSTENFNISRDSCCPASKCSSAYNYDTDEVFMSFDTKTSIWNLQTNTVGTEEDLHTSILTDSSFVYGGGKYITLSIYNDVVVALYYKNSDSIFWTLVDTDVDNNMYVFFAYTYGHEVNNALI